MSVPKRKRVSKKTKLSWRKHVNIEDVENFLEDKRLEERLGKPVGEKTNEELFKVDTSPVLTKCLSSKQKRRMMLREKLPRCIAMLQPHSEVPDPVIKRNRVRTKEERKNQLIKKKDEQRRQNGILKAKEMQSQRDRKLYEITKANKPKKGEFNLDIWNFADVNKDHFSSEWIQTDTQYHTLRGTGKLTKVIPKSVHKKNSVLPSVTLPHPGTSYNPTFAQHQELLQVVAEKEKKIIKKEDHLKRVTQGMFSKITRAEQEENWLVEMSQGLEKGDTEVNEEEYKPINPPVENKKKNLKQRRKQKEQQRLEQAKKSAKKDKKKIADIYKLKFLKKKLDKTEKLTALLKAKRLKKAAYKEKEPKRLSSIQFEEEEVYFNMPEDIAGNLRNVKKEGSVLLERFKSLQKRNILQPTIKRTRLYGKIKRFTKPGHKDDWKVTVAKPANKA